MTDRVLAERNLGLVEVRTGLRGIEIWDAGVSEGTWDEGKHQGAYARILKS